jgi:hypothetical protein
MEPSIVNLKQSIEKLLDAIKDNFTIEGDADGLWLMVRHVLYYKGDTIKYTDFMIKFVNDNTLVILVPAKAKVGAGKKACEHFMQKGEYLKGWRAICPRAVTYQGDDIADLINQIVKLLGHPNVCDQMNCEDRVCFEEDSPTLFDINPKEGGYENEPIK